MSISNDSITIQETLIIKVLKSTCKKLWCLSVRKKSTLLYFFLKIFQRNSKPVILGNLGKPAHKMMFFYLRCLSTGKKSISSFTFSLRYCKLAILGTLGIANYAHPNWYYQFVEILVFICRQKINFIPHIFWGYYKDLGTSYFGYFEHAWLRTPRMIVSTCRKFQFLSVCQK